MTTVLKSNEMKAKLGVAKYETMSNVTKRFDKIKRRKSSCLDTEWSDAPDEFTGKRVRVAGPFRPTLCVALHAVDAADFVGDGVVERLLL